MNERVDEQKYSKDDVRRVLGQMMQSILDSNVDLLINSLEPSYEIANNLPVVDETGVVWSSAKQARDCEHPRACGKLTVLISEPKALEIAHMVWRRRWERASKLDLFYDALNFYKREGK